MSELELTQKLQMASRLCLNVFLQQMLSYFGQRCAASPLVEILLDKRICRTTLTKEQLQPLRWPCSEVECSAGNFRNEAVSVGFFRRHPFAVWFVPCEGFSQIWSSMLQNVYFRAWAGSLPPAAKPEPTSSFDTVERGLRGPFNSA